MGMTVKVLDFGIAKGGPSGAQSNLTSMGSIIGTPDYMSSEQVMNEGPCTPATDLYALAAVLYRALTGTVPFVGKSVTEQLVRITTDPLRPASSIEPSIPPALDGWFETALAKDPASRPATARAFVDSLMLACSRTGGADRLSGVSWVDSTGSNAAIPSSLAPAILGADSIKNPTTTKAITLEGRREEPLTVPVAPRTGLFVAAGLAGLLTAAGLVFLLSSHFGTADRDGAAESTLAATAPGTDSAPPSASESAASVPDGAVPPAAISAVPATSTTTITPAATTTPRSTPTSTAIAVGKPPKATPKTIKAKPPGPTTKKTNETDYY
jgi:eukaryotic-like serine/threonine-protein kinase